VAGAAQVGSRLATSDLSVRECAQDDGGTIVNGPNRCLDGFVGWEISQAGKMIALGGRAKEV